MLHTQRNAYKTAVKPEGKRVLGRPTHGWENKAKRVFKYVDCVRNCGLDSLAVDSEQWHAAVCTGSMQGGEIPD